MEEQDLILLKKFMEKIWPGYRNNVYRALYRTYHPSTYNEGFSTPMDNMIDATEEIDVALTKGENYGLIDKLTGYKFPEAPELHIDEGTSPHRHPWMVATLLFNVLWDIVEEFRCYCGEGGIDPDCKGKCIGDFPYLYEDYNNLHDYMEELEDLGAPLDILLDEYPLQLNKIQLVPDYPYRPHEHGHGMRLTEDIDKFLSRRLSVVRESIYTLNDGDLLEESGQHKLEHQMCELFNLHKHEASEHLFNWSIKDVIKEHNLMMNPSDNKKNELRDHLFDQLDDNFGVFPHPDGELDFEGQPVAIYSFEFNEFVPFDSLYDPLSNLLDRGIDQESIELFIEIITEWVSYRMTEKPEMVNESKMSGIDLKKKKEKYSEEYLEILNRFPEELQREIVDERPKGDNLDIDELKGWQLNSTKPIEVSLSDLIKTKETQGSVARSTQEVVDIVNNHWGTSIELAKKLYDPNPERYIKDAKQFGGSTAPPSIMVNGDVVWGVGRMIAALIRPDKTIKVWDIKDSGTHGSITEENIPQPGESHDNEDLCDELTISTEEELREKLEGMSIGKEDRNEIEKLISQMLFDTASLHPRLPSEEAETDFDISNMYGRKIQSILCTYEKKNISNLDETDIDFKGTTLGKNNDTFTDGRPPKERSNYTQSVNEHEEPGLSPELEIGDVIKVVDIEYDIDELKYNIPTRELNPEKFVPYAVVEKESVGTKSEWPFKYTLVPKDKFEEYQKTMAARTEYEGYEGYEKLLYPWVHQWIDANTPMANKVDRLTISEQKEHRLNPELEKGDHVKIISIDGEHANMPKKWEIYVVNTVSKDTYKDQKYYGLYPIDQTDEQLTSSMLAGGGKPRELYLYRGDEWIKVEGESPLIKKLNGMEVEIDTVKYDLGWVDEETGDATGNQFFEISNPRFAPISFGGDSTIRNDLFKYDLIFREEESGVLEKFFTREELERMLNQQGIKDKLEKAIYENYLKLYGMRTPYIKLETVFADDDTDKVLSEDILNTFKVISELKVVN